MNWQDYKKGALWINTSGDKEFLRGEVTIDGTKHKIICYKNSFKKEGEITPDWNLFVDVPDKKDYQEKQPNQNPAPAQQQAPVEDDDIPF